MCHYFRLSKPLLLNRVMSRFSVEIVLSHSTESFRRRTFLCFRKFGVSKNVRDKRGGGYHDFLSKLFCLTVPNHFVEEPFCVSESFGYRKMLGIREGRVSQFSVEIVLSHSTESFRRGTLLCFRKFGISKNCMPKRGISGSSIEYLLSHSTENLRRTTLLCCVSENFR